MVEDVHARDLVELAAQIAIYGPALAKSDEPISRTGLELYWKASKSRLDRWGQTFRKYERETQAVGSSWARNQWPAVAPVIEEVLTGEILCRVWCALLKAHDRRRGQVEAEPVGRTIYVGHTESHNRALRLLATSPKEWATDARQLDLLRRRCERWTDLLISYLAPCCDVSELAPSPSRMRDFAEASERHRLSGAIVHSQTLALSSLRQSFRTGLCEVSPNADLNSQIARGVIACLPADLLDATLIGRTLWLARVESTASEAEGMVNELLQWEGDGRG